jgi:hypothetical protein
MPMGRIVGTLLLSDLSAMGSLSDTKVPYYFPYLTLLEIFAIVSGVTGVVILVVWFNRHGRRKVIRNLNG